MLQNNTIKEKEKQEQKDLAVDKKNIMTLKLDANGNLTVNDSAVAIGSLGGMLSDFILRRGKEHIITIESDALRLHKGNAFLRK